MGHPVQVMSLGKDEQVTRKFEDNKRYKTHDYLIDFGFYNDVYHKIAKTNQRRMQDITTLNSSVSPRGVEETRSQFQARAADRLKLCLPL